jgi:hypothetical protein
MPTELFTILFPKKAKPAQQGQNGLNALAGMFYVPRKLSSNRHMISLRVLRYAVNRFATLPLRVSVGQAISFVREEWISHSVLRYVEQQNRLEFPVLKEFSLSTHQIPVFALLDFSTPFRCKPVARGPVANKSRCN